MEERSAGQIIGMSMNCSEEDHRGRKRKGYHVFISRFFGEFGMLPSEEQRELIRGSDVAAGVGCGGEEELLDSTDSRLYTVKREDVMRYGCSIWNSMDNNIKNAWNMRATRLNNRPVPGLLLEVPQQLNNDLFLRSINLEWQVLVNNM